MIDVIYLINCDLDLPSTGIQEVVNTELWCERITGMHRIIIYLRCVETRTSAENSDLVLMLLWLA